MRYLNLIQTDVFAGDDDHREGAAAREEHDRRRHRQERRRPINHGLISGNAVSVVFLKRPFRQSGTQGSQASDVPSSKARE